MQSDRPLDVFATRCDTQWLSAVYPILRVRPHVYIFHSWKTYRTHLSDTDKILRKVIVCPFVLSTRKISDFHGHKRVFPSLESCHFSVNLFRVIRFIQRFIFPTSLYYYFPLLSLSSRHVIGKLPWFLCVDTCIFRPIKIYLFILNVLYNVWFDIAHYKRSIFLRLRWITQILQYD